MKNVLVTGANGQLSECIKKAASAYPDLAIQYASIEDLDITDTTAVQSFFNAGNFEVCINTAAYTAVDRAESERELAFAVNAEAMKHLAKVCADQQVTLIQVSTDYVFDGNKNNPYTVEDPTGPINVYGASKLAGEQYVQELCTRYFIVRTSWLYSQFGHNFFKTILKHADAGNPLTITTEQLGSPTNANDLAIALLEIAKSDSKSYGMYHFSNEGEATWYDFARAILEESGQLATTNLAKTDHYRTFAKRPKYSILDSTKLYGEFNVTPVHWRDSLKTLFVEYNNQK